MRTLLIKEILTKLYQHKTVQDLLSRLKLEKFPVYVDGTQPGLLSFLLNIVHEKSCGASIIITPTEQEAENLYQDISTFFPEKILFLPWWNVMPYKDVSPVSALFAARAAVLTRFSTEKELIMVTSLRSFITPVPDPEFLRTNILSIRKGDSLDISRLANRLREFGYLRVPKVSVKGEFAVRGEVLDIFIPDYEEAARIVVEFGEVDEIRRFDPISQVSTEICSEINLYPVREVIFTDSVLAVLKANLDAAGCPPDVVTAFIEKLQLNPEIYGAELYYPLCFMKQFSLLDFKQHDEFTIFLLENELLENNYLTIKKEHEELYRLASAANPLAPSPDYTLLDFPGLLEKEQRKIVFTALKKEAFTHLRIEFHCEPPRSFFGNINYLKDELRALIGTGYTIYIFAVYEYQADRLKAMLKDLDVKIIPESIFSGFSIPELKLAVISESEIFGRKKKIPKSIQKSKSRIIDSFVDLSPGDYIVHLKYGIGIFKGIQRIKTSFNEKDYIHLEYDAEEMVYIPIEQVNLIQKYIAAGDRKPKLDKIGGKSWDVRKAKVKKSVEDLAQMLVRLYSKRQKVQGFAFPADTEWQDQFEAGFPYQETEDQLKCINEVKGDMESAQPMDRLVCGDVGYGKTEIALRAAFKAVMGGKQVALLAPTTILVEQHFENFSDRFKKFPVSINMLSRFRSKAEQKTVLEKLNSGEADIVIGTHRLVQKDVVFKNLGLLIIDEEQRFGVKHKERLKQLKTSVDCLTLTATPIPRTLHMSLMKIRDMSILNTPPQNRLPIETIIEEFDDQIVVKAVRREIEREGQVFYLHNRVNTIREVYIFLQQLLPDVAMDIAHGQMEADELEDVMHRFIHNEFQVLISTTIIENGIDIPNVNTIIIDRADMYGISQLYQLRGRVGRSQRVAYAYLLYPKDQALTELAMKRLRIISDYTELGSGFKIALKDLEIRGAGNLLGREQSGEILAVGFDMYIKLLEDALAELGEDKEEPVQEVYLELEYSGFIPDEYISDPMEKMEVYKLIAAIANQEELDRSYSEIVDRFGPLPDSVMSVLSIAEIRIICNKLSIASLKERSGIIEVEFAQLYKISVDKVLRLINESGGRVYLDQKKPNCLFLKVGNIQLHEKSEFIRDRLSRLLAQ